MSKCILTHREWAGRCIGRPERFSPFPTPHHIRLGAKKPAVALDQSPCTMVDEDEDEYYNPEFMEHPIFHDIFNGDLEAVQELVLVDVAVLEEREWE